MSANKKLYIGNDETIEVEDLKIAQKDFYLFCFHLTGCSVRMQLFWCSLGIFTFYILYGYLQELIFTLDGFRPFGWYLTLVQFGYYTIFGWVECCIKGTSRRIPISMYLVLALLTLGTMGFSNSSLGYLNYPTQVNKSI